MSHDEHPKPRNRKRTKPKSNKRYQDQVNNLLLKAAKIAVDRDITNLIVPVRLVHAARSQTERLENISEDGVLCYEKSSKRDYYEIYRKYSDGTQIPTGETSSTKPDCDAC